ncbi:aminomethyl-transferring glycine dehydrogenase subunit GcvPB [bacterium]|nr:aminomethyl-transferring glycine dehydrogenase subunit GcvPB [bacterium]MBU4561606.1 aminomethyl-transferring glycine dehydrogenase subunit GcvPB [bacterium]MCG2676364.1 aminomethyl-transferring glycine dehydrogenase subunit GcvPB [bacterium]MCG2677873.1 aminomethyl-transferring glycine dehydrogenase subunit GcvPB [bacterium]
MKLIFEKGRPGRVGISLPDCDVPEKRIEELIPRDSLRSKLNLPEVSEVEVVRHYTKLSTRNYGIDTGFYPLGSCTMKYNPKVNEEIAKLPGFKSLHPLQNEKLAQGALELMSHLEQILCEITGMDGFTLQPAAGAHGELAGLMMVKACFEHKKEKRTKIIVPDSSHGTNPASASLCGYESITVKSNERGTVDLKELKKVLNEDVACFMLTNPNTLGLFEEEILEISALAHNKRTLIYCDGANMNALLGMARPGDMGFDIIHLNLHKTFSTPHGGGGPGSGPVGVKKSLIPFLPRPSIRKEKDKYRLDYDSPLSIGRIKSFYGNFSVLVKAYAYLRALGPEGLREVAENAVLNANYLMEKLKSYYHLPFDRICMHEFVLSGKRQLEKGVYTNDIAKRLLDYGFHAPTIYFPLIVSEAIMIEPTETESKETLDEFAEAMIKIAKEAEENPELVKTSPHPSAEGGRSRLDAVTAARKPNLRWK